MALALGADACAIGRAYLYGLMAGGEPGVNKALDILAEQFRRTMQLLGVRSVAELRAAGRDAARSQVTAWCRPDSCSASPSPRWC